MSIAEPLLRRIIEIGQLGRVGHGGGHALVVGCASGRTGPLPAGLPVWGL